VQFSGLGLRRGKSARRGDSASLAKSLVTDGYTTLVLDRLAKQMRDVMDSERTSIFARDRRLPGTAIAVAACGPHEGIVGSRFSAVAGLPGIVSRDDGLSQGGRAVARAERNGRILGALVAMAGGGRRFAAQELGLLAELAETAAAALDHAERREDSLRALRTRVGELVGLVEAHDGYTGGHSQAVVGWSCAVGERLRLTQPDLFELELGALLHDLGKVRVPGAVLRKPAPLGRFEKRVVDHHPAWGAELLASVPGLEPVATIVRFHHERWDGSGYPHRLRGERIPLASRIVAVCDAYDAMTSSRPYRGALPPRVAVRELEVGAGSQFDPAVVRCFIELLAEGRGPAALLTRRKVAA
jgi:HD-GYP domain-containing protein (c-di-GMP phosphodiesterase class II)